MNQELLVYTQKISPRVRYVFKHVFTRVLHVSISFTNEVNEFIAHEGPKLSYTQKQLGNELHFRSVELLFEQGINDAAIQVTDWDGVPCFFAVKDQSSALPYDIFAASFYLLSRYEEYLPHVKDRLGRFPSGESLASEHGFLQLPVIDIWILRVQEIFCEHYQEVQTRHSSFKLDVIIEVSQAFLYRKVGFLRTVGGYVQDLAKLRLRSVFNRTRVILGLRKDPYDIFTWLINVQKQTKHTFKVLFELGDQTGETTNIKYSKATFQSLIKMVGDYCNVGLLASTVSSENVTALKVEKSRLESIVNRPLEVVQFADYQFTIPNSYRNLLDQEVSQDCSLGYSGEIGFRASTCRSFLFYDLDYEMQTPLILVPTSLPLEAVVDENNKTINLVEVNTLKSVIRDVGGLFAISCSNEFLAMPHWRKLLKKLIVDI